VSGALTKVGAVALFLALVTAPACGGGGGSSSDVGGSPSPSVAASFIPDQPTPVAGNVAMAQGTKTNDIVTVTVTLTDTNGVLGAAFEVVYDPVHCAYMGFSNGTALEQGGDVPNYTIGVDPANLGRVVAAIVRSGGTTTNVAGTRTLVSLQFRVKEAGTYPLTIENASVYDGQPTPQPLPGISWFGGALRGV